MVEERAARAAAAAATTVPPRAAEPATDPSGTAGAEESAASPAEATTPAAKADREPTAAPATDEHATSLDDNVSVRLTTSSLAPSSAIDLVRSPSAGATVLFAGSTRATTSSRPVANLTYTAYIPLALRTLSAIAAEIREKYGLVKVAVQHRLGEVPVGEDSILVAVSAAHRAEAWKGAEEVLEKCKERAEVWKCEVFVDELGEGREGKGGKGTWRANRDGALPA